MPARAKIHCKCFECDGKARTYPRCRVRSSPKPDQTGKLDITGRYEDEAQSPEFTCQVNQAGSHIEGWLQFIIVAEKGKVLAARFRERKRQTYIISGDISSISEKTFKVDIIDDWKNYGQQVGSAKITTITPGRLSIEGVIQHQDTGAVWKKRKGRYRIETIYKPGETYKLKAVMSFSGPFPNRPRLSDKAIKQLPEKLHDTIAAIETAPIPHKYLGEIKTIFSQRRIIDFVERWKSHENKPTSQSRRSRRALMSHFNDYVGKFWSRFHPDVGPTLRWHIHRYLSSLRKKGNYRTLLDELAIAVSRTSGATENEFPFLGKQGLDVIRRDLADTEYFYEVSILLLGAMVKTPLGGGGYGGSIKIKRFPTDKAWGPKPKTFDLKLGGIHLSYGMGVSANMIASGNASTFADWQPENFLGNVILFDVASIWGSLGGGGTAGFPQLVVFGDRLWPCIVFDLSGLEPIFGGGYGISSTLLFGSISRGPSKEYEEPESTSTPFEIEITDKENFDLGCSVIEESGRSLVRKMCAKELFFFSSAYSSLRIDGHTDRVDCRAKNKELSEWRAENALQAIRDTLGKKFSIPRSAIALKGFGEEKAESAYEDDGLPNRKYRKVEIALNGRALVKLQGR